MSFAVRTDLLSAEMPKPESVLLRADAGLPESVGVVLVLHSDRRGSHPGVSGRYRRADLDAVDGAGAVSIGSPVCDKRPG